MLRNCCARFFGYGQKEEVKELVAQEKNEEIRLATQYFKENKVLLKDYIKNLPELYQPNRIVNVEYRTKDSSWWVHHQREEDASIITGHSIPPETAQQLISLSNSNSLKPK